MLYWHFVDAVWITVVLVVYLGMLVMYIHTILMVVIYHSIYRVVP